MAKRRKHTALFEVFGSGNTSSSSGERSTGWGLRAPAWFGRKGASDSSSDGFDAFSSSSSSAENDPTMSSTALERFSPRVVEDEPSTPSRPGMRLSVDSSDQTINLALSYSSAAVAGFSLLVVVALAFVLGKHSGRGPLPLLADRTTEQVKKDLPRGDVLNVSSEPSLAGAINPEVSVPVPIPASRQPAPRSNVKPTWNDPRPPSTLEVDDEKRTIGLNYVIVQSYPDKKDAEAARDLLVKRGILCTVEPTPANWFSNNGAQWYSVIGIKGFSKIRDSEEFERYKASILEVSNEFAGRSRFKRFEPTAIKWRGDTKP